jgi:hypothetical protein
MKKKIFSLIAVAAALVLAGCGGAQSDASSAGATPTSSKKATSSKIPSSKHEHTFNEAIWDHNETQHWHPATCEHTTAKGSVADHDFEDFTDATHVPVAAGCETPGKAFKKCKVCGYIKEVTIPALGHSFEQVPNTTVTAEGMTEWYQVKCSRNDATGIGFSALKYVATSDPFGNKDKTDATLKMSTNGNYVDYKITLTEAMPNVRIWMHGWVDYWKDNSNNNDQRGFFIGQSGAEASETDSPNFTFTVNDENVTIDNRKTYEGMGMVAGENGNSAFAFVPVGNTALKAGENTIRYERTGSYNLNIDAIYFINIAA